MSTTSNPSRPARLASTPASPLSSALSKTSWRLIPLMFLLYVVAYLDRVNVGFAQLQMKQALSLSDAAYGFGAGLFFIPYFLFEVPSNLLLQCFGPRRWMARIMITWGLVSSATMFIRNPAGFYVLRALLGLAEAGFFPGMILYLTYWYPPRQRATAVARFMTAIGISLVIGGPLSGLIMDSLQGRHGLAGWQWLFLLEGLPSVTLGAVVLFVLPDGPGAVRWLSPAEKAALAAELATQPERGQHLRLRAALRDGRLWLLSLIYFIFAMALYGLTLWVPQLLKDIFGGSITRIGWLTAIPYSFAVAGMIVSGRLADRSGAYRRSLLLATAVAGLALAVAAWALRVGPVVTLCAITVGVVGLYSSFGPFWAVSSAFLRGTAAAGGIAVINSVGNLGGFVSPYAVGLVKRHTGGFAGGIGLIAGAMLLSLLLIALGIRERDRGR